LFVAWRHVYPGNLRDIAFAPSSDGGRTFSAPVRISQDGWQLDGCPENGPTMVLDGTQRVHVIWPTLVRQSGPETLRLFHASTRDGYTFTARSSLPVTSAAYHPQAILGPNRQRDPSAVRGPSLRRSGMPSSANAYIACAMTCTKRHLHDLGVRRRCNRVSCIRNRRRAVLDHQTSNPGLCQCEPTSQKHEWPQSSNELRPLFEMFWSGREDLNLRPLGPEPTRNVHIFE